jgi:uncharacterized membrane protein YcgQ (UPF0703/DUF1980 family)
MNKTTQSVMISLLGGLLISITVSGRYTSYVKPSYGPLLVIGGVILIVVGVLSIIVGLRDDRQADQALEERASLEPAQFTVLAPEQAGSHGCSADGEHVVLHAHGYADVPGEDHVPGPGDGDDAHGHSHDRSKAPWLILAPILVLLLLAPPALGASAVSRNAGSQALAGLSGVAASSGTGADVGAGGSAGGYAPNDGSGSAVGTKAFAKQRPTMSFPALAAGKAPMLTIKDFVLRALYDGTNSVSNNDITVAGFIADAGDGYQGGYSLARMTISCCAADATPMRVHIQDAAKYPVNSWVIAVISAEPGTANADNDYVPTVDVTSMRPISQPSDPYEH